jgi:hypothetical protein
MYFISKAINTMMTYLWKSENLFIGVVLWNGHSSRAMIIINELENAKIFKQ